MLGSWLLCCHIPQAQDTKPPHEITTTIAARWPIVRADRQEHLASCPVQFIRDLCARGACTDDQDSPIIQLVEITILGRMQLGDISGLRYEWWNNGMLKGTCGNHDPGCFDIALRRGDMKSGALFDWFGLQHFDTGAHRCLHHFGVFFNVISHPVFADKFIRCVAVEFQIWKPVMPNRAVRDQRIPTRRAPCFCNAVLFQNHKRDAM